MEQVWSSPYSYYQGLVGLCTFTALSYWNNNSMKYKYLLIGLLRIISLLVGLGPQLGLQTANQPFDLYLVVSSYMVLQLVAILSQPDNSTRGTLILLINVFNQVNTWAGFRLSPHVLLYLPITCSQSDPIQVIVFQPENLPVKVYIDISNWINTCALFSWACASIQFQT